jgi:hypothetical protein
MTVDGYMIDVECDEQMLRVQGKTKVSRMALAGADHDKGDVLIPRSDIAKVTFEGANPLKNGKVVVTTTAGRKYQLHFRRKQQGDFQRLAAELGA